MTATVNTCRIPIHSFLLPVDVFCQQYQPTTRVFHKAMNFIASWSEFTNCFVLHGTYRSNAAVYLKASVSDVCEGTSGCNEYCTASAYDLHWIWLHACNCRQGNCKGSSLMKQSAGITGKTDGKKLVIMIQEIMFKRNKHRKIMFRRSQEILGFIVKIDWKMWVK